MMQYETVIGLEVHVQLKTKSKIFSGTATQYGAKSNTQANIIDLGLPGTLPVLNKQAVNFAIKFGLSVGANIAEYSVFERKNYFYPDLPKGYQISQLQHPIVTGGHIEIAFDDSTKKINLTRAHLEEDAGKSLHEKFHDKTGIDLNRAGVPLLEIVSEPELRSAKEAVSYLKTLHNLVRFIDISDGNMQEGSFRCDVNVSIRPKGETKLGTRTEIKNVNSFRFVEKSLDYEIQRQIAVVESGGKIIQETRLYDSNKNETKSMRSKEEATDYRYFPDPDLLPVHVDAKMLAKVKQSLPELPQRKRQRFIKEYALALTDASFVTSDRALADYFETVLAEEKVEAKLVVNWLQGELSAALNKHEISINECPVTAKLLSGLLIRITDNTISNKMAKKVFELIWQGQGNADEIIAKQNFKQVSDDSAIEAIIDDIITNNPQQVEQYRSGKEKVFAFFVGQVMKATKGSANPQIVNALLKVKLRV